MTRHEEVQAMLALSAAGLLEPGEERTLREHVRECAECAAQLQLLGSLAGTLGALPAPLPPPDLALRTAALLAAEMAAANDRRQGAWLGVAGAALGWVFLLGLWSVYRVFEGAWPGIWAWLAVSIAMAAVAAPVAALLQRFRRMERRTV